MMYNLYLKTETQKVYKTTTQIWLQQKNTQLKKN